jgi:hypothetical protein
MEMLDDHDDVQKVSSNIDISDEVMEQLEKQSHMVSYTANLQLIFSLTLINVTPA